MKYEKEFREAHPETIGETDMAFDMSNYITWLDNRVEQLESHAIKIGEIGQLKEEIEKLNENQMYIIDKLFAKLEKLSHGDWSEEARLVLDKIEGYLEKLTTRQSYDGTDS